MSSSYNIEYKKYKKYKKNYKIIKILIMAVVVEQKYSLMIILVEKQLNFYKKLVILYMILI